MKQMQYSLRSSISCCLSHWHLKSLVSISQNGLSPIALNKKIDNNLNKHIINASIHLAPGPFDFPKRTAVDFPFLVTPPDFPGFAAFGAEGTGGCQPETSTSGNTGGGTKFGCFGRILSSSVSATSKLLILI